MKRRFCILFTLCIIMVVAVCMTFNVYATACSNGENHQFDIVLIKQATENQNGIRKYTCVKCGYSYKESIPRTGHNWGPWEIVQAPTCISEGLEERYCQNQHATVQKEQRIVASTKEHDFQLVKTKKASCKNGEENTYRCKVCGREKTEIKGKGIGHNWGDWETKKEATATAVGIEIRVCKNNNDHKQERELPKIITATKQTSTEKNNEGWTAVNTGVLALNGALLCLLGIALYVFAMPLLWARRKKKEFKNRMLKGNEEDL